MRKVCLSCHMEKILEDFHKARDKPDGRRNTCKVCRSKNYSSTIPTHMKCFGCNEVLPFTKEYFKINNRAKITKFRRKCIACYELDELNRHYLRKYKISIEQVKTMSKVQNHQCAICEKAHKLFVDHNHITGKTRQLLCDLCNRGIGYLQENITILQNAINYLKHHQ